MARNFSSDGEPSPTNNKVVLTPPTRFCVDCIFSPKKRKRITRNSFFTITFYYRQSQKKKKKKKIRSASYDIFTETILNIGLGVLSTLSALSCQPVSNNTHPHEGDTHTWHGLHTSGKEQLVLLVFQGNGETTKCRM